MLAGISTACFYPQHTEDALRELSALSIQCTEVFINCASELSEPFLKQLRAIANGGGVQILSLHPYTSGMEPMYFFSQYDRRFQEGRELYKRYYHAANLLGADITVFHGGTRNNQMEQGEYFDRFGLLWEDARQQGIALCHENVSRCAGYCPEFFSELVKAIPDAEFVFDVKQAVRAGQDVVGFAGKLNGKIRHLHISDHNDINDCLPPGKGTFNIAKFLSNIRSVGFDGGVVVELYRENFGTIVEIYEGYQHLCTELSTASKNC